jgi:hypothetical protein
MTDKTSPLLDQIAVEAAEADAAAVAEQERLRQAWDRHEKDERCRAAVGAFLRAEEGHDAVRMYQTLRIACAALQEIGRLKAWEQVDHEQTYRDHRYWNNREMSVPTYRAARRLFEAACNQELAEDELVAVWQKVSLRAAFRWLRIFLYGLSGEAIILRYLPKVAAPIAGVPPRADPPPRKQKRMSVAEANAKAMELAKQRDRDFFDLSERQQARMIGTTWRTWSRTPLYRQERERKEKLRAKLAKQGTASKSPSVVGFTGTLEAVVREDKSLKELIAEQRQDDEPSPLEDDPPGSRGRKVYTRKEL